MYLQASHKFIKFTFAMSLRLTIDVQIKKIINPKLYYSQVHIILETIFNSFFETWILCHFYKSTGNMKQNHLFKAPDNFFCDKKSSRLCKQFIWCFFHTRAWVTEKIPFMQLPAKFMDNFLSFIVPYTILSTF